MPFTRNRFFTIKEEVANSVIHAIGVGLSIAGLTLLIVLSSIYGNAWHIVSFSVYGATLVLLYSSSTLYHIIRNRKAKRVFRVLDHSSIYLLIAGTYTPFLLVALRESVGIILLIIIWSLAILGVLFKVFFIHRAPKLSVLTYALMGWFCIFGIPELITMLPTGSLVLLVVGGVVYTAGIIFYAWKKLPYNHAIWHVFVLVGSICHFLAISLYLLPSTLSLIL